MRTETRTPGPDRPDESALWDELRAIARHHMWAEPLERDPEQELVLAARAALGLAHVVPASNGTAALHAALHALGVRPGDEVIVPVNTCAAVPLAVLHAGGLPVLADVDESLTLSAASAAARVSPRTRAVVVVHQFGIVADVPGVRRALPAGVAVVEDCAQAIGATRAGQPVGHEGDAAVFSFCHGKIVSAGQGGLVAARDAALARRAARFAALGADRPPLHSELGFNFRMPPLVAPIVAHQIARLPAIVARRAVLAARYRAHLEPAGFRAVASRAPGAGSVFHRQVMLAPSGDPLYARWAGQLAKDGVLFQPRHPSPLYRSPILRAAYASAPWRCLLDDPTAHFPVACAADERIVFLYVRPDFTEATVDQVSRALSAAWASVEAETRTDAGSAAAALADAGATAAARAMTMSPTRTTTPTSMPTTLPTSAPSSAPATVPIATPTSAPSMTMPRTCLVLLDEPGALPAGGPACLGRAARREVVTYLDHRTKLRFADHVADERRVAWSEPERARPVEEIRRAAAGGRLLAFTSGDIGLALIVEALAGDQPTLVSVSAQRGRAGDARARQLGLPVVALGSDAPPVEVLAPAAGSTSIVSVHLDVLHPRFAPGLGAGQWDTRELLRAVRVLVGAGVLAFELCAGGLVGDERGPTFLAALAVLQTALERWRAAP